MEPAWQVSGALGGVEVGASVGPFAEQALYEALGLAIGSWVRMPNSQRSPGAWLIRGEERQTESQRRRHRAVARGAKEVGEDGERNSGRVLGRTAPHQRHNLRGVHDGQQQCHGRD